MNNYVQVVHKCLGHYINKKISSSSHLLPPVTLAFDVEDFLHESGLVVDDCIPTTLQDNEKNKQLKGVPGLVAAGAAGGEPLRPPKSKSDMFRTRIPSFSHQQTNENVVDEMYGRLVRTKLGGKGNKPYAVVRSGMSHAQMVKRSQRIGTPTQFITLTPTETLCILTYIREPYTSNGRNTFG